MLKDLNVAGVLPASDLARARDFYRDKLGLEPDNPEATDNLMYKCANGTAFLLYETPTPEPPRTPSWDSRAPTWTRT